MKILYFDCFSGISGDMSLGALIDLGVDVEVFKRELAKLNLPGYEIEVRKKVQSGITGTDLDVKLTNEPIAHKHSHYEQEHAQHHSHEGHHHHGHEHRHSHHEDHLYDEGGEEHHHSYGERSLTDIEGLIDASSLNRHVKEFSKKVFREIARAEAKVHNKSIHEVHFHEVGAVDSIVDIVGVSICLDLLGVEKVYSSPLHEGQGFIQCQHGTLPVPVPAVMEMLSGSNIPLITEDINTELVTPTGIGIIKCLASSFGNMPSIRIEKVGYGMGKRETGRLNALRVIMGTLAEEKDTLEEIVILETNIDDMSPEILGYAMEKLLGSSALDVFYTPIYMKKNRPAVMLTVLTKRESEEKLVDILLRETSTLGIRRSMTVRYCMDREIIRVETDYGVVRVKLAFRGDIRKYAPEYEDCREIAQKTGIPLAKVYELVIKKAGEYAIL